MARRRKRGTPIVDINIYLTATEARRLIKGLQSYVILRPRRNLNNISKDARLVVREPFLKALDGSVLYAADYEEGIERDDVRAANVAKHWTSASKCSTELVRYVMPVIDHQIFEIQEIPEEVLEGYLDPTEYDKFMAKHGLALSPRKMAFSRRWDKEMIGKKAYSYVYSENPLVHVFNVQQALGIGDL